MNKQEFFKTLVLLGVFSADIYQRAMEASATTIRTPQQHTVYAGIKGAWVWRDVEMKECEITGWKRPIRTSEFYTYQRLFEEWSTL